MEWNATTPSLWDWDSQRSCDAGNYKPPGGRGGDCSKAAVVSTSSSTGSSLIVPAMAGVSTPAIEFEDYQKGGSAISFQDAAYSSPATVAEEKTSTTPIGLKFGQRTYFEVVSQADQSVVVLPLKKLRCDQSLQQQEQAIYCQVEGCDVDLSGSKEYYRKHRVCKDHTKCPRVIIAGEERRFCQQCSRFHELLEFDEKKRSCRKRLSDHNARRRKPQPDMISFCSSILSLSTYDDNDGAHQISFQRDKVSTPSSNMRPGAKSSTWGFLKDSKLPKTRSWPLMKNAGHEAGHLREPNTQHRSTGGTAVNNEVKSIRPLRGGSTAGVLNQISSAVASASNLGGGLDKLPGAPSPSCPQIILGLHLILEKR